MDKMTPRVLVVDDDPGVLSALRRALVLDGHDVLVASDAETAMEMARSTAPHVVVLDVVLPDVDGLTVCQHLRRSSVASVLMLSARDTVPDRVAGFEHGADDYLVKPFALDELIARVRALLRRHRDEQGETLSYADLTVDVSTREAYRAGRVLKLTPREYDLLVVFLNHKRQALSREQLCQRVWGYGFEGESNFVDVAVKQLRKKLEDRGASRLIQTVRSYGYALRTN